MIEHPTLEPEYREELTLRVRRELARGPQEFPDLVRAAEGAYPLDVLSALHLLETDETVGALASRLSLDAQNPKKKAGPQSCIGYHQFLDDLPEPHPLDFDWRFSRSTLSFLERQIGALPTDKVAVLGAPTLFTSLSDSGLNAHLFDKNQHVINHLKAAGYPCATHCDLFSFCAQGDHFQSAIADPPWYLEHYQAFLTASRALLVPEGKLFLSVLPRLTRPSAANDRLEIVDFAANLGFDLIEVRAAELHYLSPPFEVEALKADGFMLNDWRSGDLFSFILRSRSIREPKTVAPVTEETWQTVKLGRTMVRIKHESGKAAESLTFQPVSPTGNVRLRSVSRRSPVRSRITVWTSRNIALDVSKTDPLAEALRRIENGETIAGALLGVTYQYQLGGEETKKLQEIIELLVRDAGITWNA